MGALNKGLPLRGAIVRPLTILSEVAGLILNGITEAAKVSKGTES